MADDTEYKHIRVKPATHHLLRIGAALCGVSILEYLGKLARGDAESISKLQFVAKQAGYEPVEEKPN